MHLLSVPLRTRTSRYEALALGPTLIRTWNARLRPLRGPLFLPQTGSQIEADARTRTGDPFITSDARNGLPRAQIGFYTWTHGLVGEAKPGLGRPGLDTNLTQVGPEDGLRVSAS